MVEAGKLIVITGPMFSGKTTKLISEISKARKKNLRAVVLKSAIDTRYSRSDVVSHDGLKLPAMVLPDGEACIPVLRRIACDYDVIGIDEGHFWDGVPGLAAALDDLAFDSKIIYVSMLNRKNMGTSFDIGEKLLPLADHIYSLGAHCSQCGRKAAFTQRITNYRTGGKQKFVGGAGDYEPRCRTHFMRQKLVGQSSLAEPITASPKSAQKIRTKIPISPQTLPSP